MCHRRQPLDCINHPAEYLQCTQLVPTGRLDCAVGYEYESWTSEGIVCEPACQCHSRSQWTCQSKCPLSLTASQYSWLAVVLRPLADRSTSRDIGVRSGMWELDVSSSSVPNSATEYAGDMIGSVERDDSVSCQEANQGSRKSESRPLDNKGELSGGCPEHRNATGFADTPHMKSGEGYTQLPEYLRALYDETCKRLTSKQAEKVLAVLLRYQAVFAATDLDIGRFTALVHYIKTGTAFPIRQRMRRSPLGFEQEEKKTIDSMMDAGVIEQSQSEWASPPVLVRKKDGSWRYCIDFRAVKNVTTKDAYPLPLIEECMDSLAGKKFFCTLDMNSGYWQIPVAPEDKEKTAFITRYGLYQFTRMPFGLSNSPASFQRAMHLVLSGLIWNVVIVYLDDINVMGSTFEETLQNLATVLQRFEHYGLKLKPRKCKLFISEAKFLGRLANADGIQVTPEHVQSIQEWPLPKNKKELQQFLGFVNYHRSFVPGLAGICAPLYQLTGQKVTWAWDGRHTEAFNALKVAMTSPPVLGYPNAVDTFILDTDASDFAIGAALSQVQAGKEQPISFASKSLNTKQQQYCTTRKELLAVVVFAQHYEHYLLGRSFIIRTDHASLTWLMRFKKIGGQLCRWLEYLARFSYAIEHRSGDKHSNAGGLSRIPQEISCDYYESGKDVKSLPCAGCTYCTKMAADWTRYEEEVDDVLPLSARLSGVLNASMNQRKEATEPGVDEPQGFSVSTADNQREEATEPGVAEPQDVSASTVAKETTDMTNIKVRMITVDSSPETQESNYMEQLTPQELRDEQLEDTDICPLITWMESGATPQDAEVLLQSASTRQLWLCRSQLRLKEGVLYYIWEEDKDRRWLFVVPASLRDMLMKQCHDSPFGGHLGREKTLSALRRRFLWYGMATDVKLYVSTCRECHLGKHPNRKPRAPLQNYQAGCLGDHVHLDILGPFCESEAGNRYVVIIVDQFSRWLEMVPLTIQDAESIARAFFESYVVRFGAPFVMHTDQGRNFDSAMMKSFCRLLEIVKTRTTPYRPSSNGQVERYNTMVLNFLRCFLRGKQRDWDKYLPVMGMNIRAMVNRSTGFTPNMLQLGHQINMPVDVMFGMSRIQNVCESASVYLKSLLQQFRKVHAEARANIKGAQCRQKKLYDVTSKVQSFDVGDLVYRRNSVVKLGQSRKLNPVFSGPYLVTEVLSPYLYRVQGHKKKLMLHHDRLKLCEDRAVPFWVSRRRRSLLQQQSATNLVEGQQAVPSAMEETESRGEQESEQQVLSSGSLNQVAMGDHDQDVEEDGSSAERRNSDLNTTMPYGIEDDQPNSDLDVTIPYSHGEVQQNSDLDSTIPYGIGEDQDPEEQASRVLSEGEDGLPEPHLWMQEEEWGLHNLFPEGQPTTRAGRTRRMPAYLRDYVTPY